jgi:hypothetical protein
MKCKYCNKKFDNPKNRKKFFCSRKCLKNNTWKKWKLNHPEYKSKYNKNWYSKLTKQEKQKIVDRNRENKRAKIVLQKRPSICEICKNQVKVCYDHNHETNLFRGWLCKKCNAGIGFFKDNPQYLLSAIDYLNKKG